MIAENAWGESPNVDFDYLRTTEGLAGVAKVADGIGPWIPQVVDNSGKKTTLVENAHKADLDLHPYTLRADALPAWAESFDDVMQRVVIEAGADGIFSDHPDLAVKFLKNKSK